MLWFEAEEYDPLWRRMLANFIMLIQGTVEFGVPCLLFILLFFVIAVACGWNPESDKKSQDSKREQLAGELAERVEGKAGTGFSKSEKCDEPERVKMEIESLQDMLRERTRKLATLATRGGERE